MKEQYTIYWLASQQQQMLQNLPFLVNEMPNAQFIPEGEYPEHFALVVDLNLNEHSDALAECVAQSILGIKPGANPGGSPTGCA